jgi:hypothetical protein
MPKIPPSIMDSQGLQQSTAGKKAQDDDAFAKFYTNLTTGTMSKLSTALAYAGLPLSPEEAPVEQSRQRMERSTVHASNDPDVKNLFSKAALAAIEDEHRQRGRQGRVFGPAESFYVVQTGGGTYSYADIAKAQAQDQSKLQQQPHPDTIEEEDQEIFVDARDAREPPSPKQSRISGQGSLRGGFSRSTSEELELENVTLKQTLEQLATRLAEFETHAQDASMAALTQSMANVKAGGAHNVVAGSVAGDRVSQLEKQLEQMTDERQKYYSLASKQDKTLKQYRAKWEDIKKSAREKDRTKKEKTTTDKPGEDGLVSANEPWKASEPAL